ncbi:MAG: hypothetical protein DPW14_05850 [Planctomycetes bacterium]|nr:hypothetical protein [Planctomycetota bacterium]
MERDPRVRGVDGTPYENLARRAILTARGAAVKELTNVDSFRGSCALAWLDAFSFRLALQAR